MNYLNLYGSSTSLFLTLAVKEYWVLLILCDFYGYFTGFQNKHQRTAMLLPHSSVLCNYVVDI